MKHNIPKIVAYILIPVLFQGCVATNSNDNAATNEQQDIDKQLSEITVSRGVLNLLANETDEDKLRAELVCGKERLPGSLQKVKVCRTQTEIEATRKNAKEDVELLQRRSLTIPIN